MKLCINLIMAFSRETQVKRDATVAPETTLIQSYCSSLVVDLAWPKIEDLNNFDDYSLLPMASL